ncbi:MAG: hypothetical protein DMF64_08675 [Acidobacteria bacterium]|nr:MAG: hypothetical protein DMF64_08675 [Acidobacteriota bacterium]
MRNSKQHAPRLVCLLAKHMTKLIGLSLVALLLFSQLSKTASAAAGDLDTTFGAGGIVTTDFFGGNDEANAVVVQTDGKSVVAGYASNTTTHNNDFALARYNPDGSLDDGTPCRRRARNAAW